MKSKKVLTLFAMSLIAVMLCAQMIRVNANPYTTTDYYSAINAAASRLVALQGPDMGWDWIITAEPPWVGPSPQNLYGVIAYGLVFAYEKTGNAAYLTAAENAANYMMTGPFNSGANPGGGDFWNNGWGYSFDYSVLMELSKVTLNPAYSAYALAAWGWQKANIGRYADGNQGPPLCPLAGSLWDHFVNGWIGANAYQIASWQFCDYALQAWEMGDHLWAQHAAQVIDNYIDNIAAAPVNPNDNEPDLGCGPALVLLETVDPVGYALDIGKLITRIETDQQPGGYWLTTAGGYSPQTAAYCIMGLVAAGQYTQALNGADWLVSYQGTLGAQPGGWAQYDDGAARYDEYSEVDSECMLALISSIAQLTVVSPYGNPSPAVGTTTYFVGTSIPASVTSPWPGATDTQYVCTGWTGTGDVPASGSGTTVTFTITKDPIITWHWKTQYKFRVTSAHDAPTPYASGSATWIDSNTLVTESVTTPADLDALGTTRYRCTGYTGTGDLASGGSGNSVSFHISQPTSVTFTWIAQYYLTVKTAPPGVTTIPGEGWYDLNWHQPLTAPAVVGKYRLITLPFSWDVDGASQGVGNPITVTMNGPHIATAHYVDTSVGGEWAPINTVQLMAPWIILGLIAMAGAGAATYRLFKKRW